MYYVLIDGYLNDIPEKFHFSIEPFHNAYEPEICEHFHCQLRHIAGIFNSREEAIAKRDDFCETEEAIV